MQMSRSRRRWQSLAAGATLADYSHNHGVVRPEEDLGEARGEVSFTIIQKHQDEPEPKLHCNHLHPSNVSTVWVAPSWAESGNPLPYPIEVPYGDADAKRGRGISPPIQVDRVSTGQVTSGNASSTSRRVLAQNPRPAQPNFSISSLRGLGSSSIVALRLGRVSSLEPIPPTTGPVHAPASLSPANRSTPRPLALSQLLAFEVVRPAAVEGLQ